MNLLTLFFWLFNVLIVLVTCFNLDYEYAVAKSGPSNTYFGFSVEGHYDKRKTGKWILVGAPKANNSGLIKKYSETGAIFKCRPNDPSFNCTEEVPFDVIPKPRPNAKKKKDIENKTGEWLGVSLKSGGKYNRKNRDVVACGHRYEFQGGSNNFRLLEGQCWIVDEQLGRNEGQRKPCNPENIGGSRTSDHTTYGQCQSGIGLDILPERFTTKDDMIVLIGAAGTKWWSGEIFQMDEDAKSKGELPKKIQDDIEENNHDEYRSSYFGYAVTYGNFFSPDVAHMASGGPRHKHFGKVLIYELKNDKVTKKGKLEVRQELVSKDIQIASGFGTALCSIDSDKNGLAELIIGAPFFLSLDEKEHPEQGIVYIYSKAPGKEKLVETRTIQGQQMSYGAFGHAVANGGDVNLDGFDDLIVGAPGEDKGQGAVYVYFGSKNGLSPDHFQRVPAEDIQSGTTDNIGFKGFGRSLGTGLDMDDNGYNDILVGAYLSDQVALLRSRPVIKVSSTLEFNPKELDASGGACNTSIDVSTCTQVKLCFNISEPSGRLNNHAVLVKYKIEADPIRGSVRKSRMKFDDTQTNQKVFIANSTVQYACQDLGTASLNTDSSIIEYPDIMFRVSYQMPYDDPAFVKPPRTDARVVSMDDYPVLYQNVEGMDGDEVQEISMSALLKFKRPCTKCIPDLELTSAKKHHTLRLGKDNYEFDVKIKNIAKDLAYSVGLEIKLPTMLTLNDFKIKGKNVACQKGGVCQNMITKLKGGESVDVSINIETGDFARNYNPKGKNNITLIVSSANKENAGTTNNNKLSLTFDLRVDADIVLYTAHSDSLPYEGKIRGESAMHAFEDVGGVVYHTYIVKNDGPDLLEKAKLTIDWPYQTSYGKHLLYLTAIEGMGPDVQCEPSKFNFLGLETTYRGSSGSASSSTRPAADQVAAKPEGKNNKRVRRDVNPDAPETAESSKQKTILLNCKTAQCMQITCMVSNMMPKDTKRIRIKALLWESSLLLDYPGEHVSIMSNAQLVIGKNASYIKDPNPDNQDQEVITLVTPVKPKKRDEKIAVWQIALAVVAGVILLALMIFGLYKVGFFRRTRRHDESNGADESLIKGTRN